ncbi:MAG: sigma factor-like helix-turn-helix DNA-binding protein [Verrucomicrobiae bacterium]|nr:sigma factor-like helix-turn-helix DNA-binding protein [Verrucomicrobiae bacterium]
MITTLNLDTFQIQGDIPQEIRQVPLSLLFITPGSLGKMHRTNVFNIDEFLNFPPQNLLAIQGVGLRTVYSIFIEIITLREKASLPSYHFDGGQTPKNPREFVDILLARLDKDEREVMIFRYGINIARRHTLQSIGEIKDITRERVRQRENKNLAYLNRIFGSYISAFIEEMRKHPDNSSTQNYERELELLFAVVDSEVES